MGSLYFMGSRMSCLIYSISNGKLFVLKIFLLAYSFNKNIFDIFAVKNINELEIFFKEMKKNEIQRYLTV